MWKCVVRESHPSFERIHNLKITLEFKSVTTHKPSKFNRLSDFELSNNKEIPYETLLSLG